MENRLKCMSWVEFDERRKQTQTVIIPSGACEVYGPHLPLGSDILVAEKLAELVAERVNAVIAPCLEVGQSHNLYGFPGTIYIRPENLKAVYRDICESFIKWGFKEIFIMNTHLGNTAPLGELLEDLENEYGVKCGLVGWWQYIWKYTDVFETSNPHGHASEAGTSVLQYLCPEYVDMNKAVNSPALFKNNFAGLNIYKMYDQYSTTGTMGDATAATVEKGRVVVERGVNEMCAFIEEYLRAK